MLVDINIFLCVVTLCLIQYWTLLVLPLGVKGRSRNAIGIKQFKNHLNILYSIQK